MPIYEYQCKVCDAIHEALQKISDDPLVICPTCGEPELKKRVTAAAFRLKGGGWYETDFKSGSKKNLAGDQSSEAGSKAKNDGGDAAGKSDSGGASAAAKDSKPAAGKANGGSSAAS